MSCFCFIFNKLNLYIADFFFVSFFLYSFFFFKQKTAYEMRISDWSSDVCSSDLIAKVAAREFKKQGLDIHLGAKVSAVAVKKNEIGRASCRERVCQYV